MTNFSPSMLKTFEICPVKYNLKFNEKISIPQNPDFFEKGKRIHALANYYHKKADITKLENALSDEEKILWDRLKYNEFFSKKCIKSEYSISTKIDNFWIFGRLDAIVQDDNDYYILDYKTGSIPKNPEKDYQTMVYLLCADEIFKEKNSISFVYIDLKNNENKVIKLSEELKKAYIQCLNEKCNSIMTTNDFMPPQNTQQCKFCEYNKICRY